MRLLFVVALLIADLAIAFLHRAEGFQCLLLKERELGAVVETQHPSAAVAQVEAVVLFMTVLSTATWRCRVSALSALRNACMESTHA